MIRNKLDFFNSDGKNKNNHGYDQKETTILHYKVLKEKNHISSLNKLYWNNLMILP